MKKIITTITAFYLFCMFLVYSGAFRDYANPIVVTKYYFDCIKNREGFLTKNISKPNFFNEDRYGILYSKYGIPLMQEIKLNILSANDEFAFVEAKIISKDKQITHATVELEISKGAWLIKSVNINKHIH